LLLNARELRDRDQAAAALVPRPLRGNQAEWAVEATPAVALDGWSVPLATANADVPQNFEIDVGPSPCVLGAG
jgi:hypothetical protein